MKKPFLEIFKNKKPIFAMLHLKGDTPEERFERAKKEFQIYLEGGVDAVIVENYYGNYYDMERMLQYLDENKFDIRVGVNCLNVDTMGFELAKRFHADFVQLDGVCGQLKLRDDPGFGEYMKLMRSQYDGYVLGGVRFKYQPVLSGRTLEEDLKIGMTRCDAIVVTQDATGQETSMEKINEFRSIMGDFPLVIGAGITAENCAKQFEVGDAAIVGSYFKDTYKDTGDVDASHVACLMDTMKEIREGEIRMIKAVRIDHRLVHGQVAFSWTKFLEADCILIASDNLMKDELKMAAMKLAKPTGVKLVMKDMENSIKAINSGVTDKYKLFVIVESVEDAYRLANGVDSIKAINVGGMKATDDRRQISKAVFISEEDEKMIRELDGRGVELYVQLVPSDNKTNVMSLL